MGLYESRANSDQGDDFEELLRLADIYCDWQTGRKKKVLGGQPLQLKKLLELQGLSPHAQPLKSKMVLELQGLSPHAREAYFANLMSL